jgi:hypothetical protein
MHTSDHTFLGNSTAILSFRGRHRPPVCSIHLFTQQDLGEALFEIRPEDIVSWKRDGRRPRPEEGLGPFGALGSSFRILHESESRSKCMDWTLDLILSLFLYQCQQRLLPRTYTLNLTISGNLTNPGSSRTVWPPREVSRRVENSRHGWPIDNGFIMDCFV